ncbi:hypothetical protein [Variovorax sp. PCZ-1]|uniref:hypothetical protein n=1 Tax=Variovorax sp. PCZ-1 TaxID=2835533 RepID=UPI001BCF064B|nr:hypothetical protein [Variovorax sp. PCZ-1]MBS7808255.1 hypothetical protein [Variovorax sp. PCZ-1]
MKPNVVTFDARKTVVGKVFAAALIASFLFGLYLIGHSILSLVERRTVDDLMQLEGKVLKGEIVNYESHQSARRGRFYWFPVIRVSAGAGVVEFIDKHTFFDSKPKKMNEVQQMVMVEFSAKYAVLRVRESYQADKPRLVRNDLLMLLLALIMSSWFPIAWFRGRRNRN